MDLDRETIQTIMPYGTWRKRFFQLRYSLDKSPRVLLTLQIVLGGIINSQPGFSFMIMIYSSNYDRFELALIPLICLCVIILILTTSSLILLISENTSNNKHLTTWHRDCAFSRLKDIYVSCMVLISLLLFLVYIDTEEKTIIFQSIFSMTLPLIILCTSSLIKCLLLRTKKTLLWVVLNLLALSEILLLILKIDYKYSISWATVIAPAGLCFVSLMLCSVFALTSRLKAGDFAGVFFCCMTIAGCGSGIALVVFVEQFLMFNIKAIYSFKVAGWITNLLLLVGYSRKSGAWLLGVIFGHMEVDFWHFKFPSKTVSLLSARAKSV